MGTGHPVFGLAIGVVFALGALMPGRAQPFVDVAAELGLNNSGSSGGIFWYDFDGDGDQDLLHSYRFNQPDRMYRNDGTHFTMLQGIGFPAASDAGKSIPVDFDHDGDLDVWLNEYGTVCQLMVNDGNVFVDRRAQLGLPPLNAGREFTWVDFNRDGWMDVLFANPYDWFLFQNEGGTHFTDVSAQMQLPGLTNISSGAETDYDLDGDIDLYVTQIGGPNFLYRNLGDGNFENRTFAAGLSLVPSHIGCAWVDFNHDKYPDLLTPDNGRHGIWRNQGDGTFTAMNVHGMDADFMGHGWPNGANYAVADYDMDGDEDVYVCRPGGWGTYTAPNQFFRQDSLVDNDIWFTEIGGALGMNFMADGMASWCDFDGDMDLDLYVSLHNQPDRLYRNDHNAPSALQVQVRGPQGDRDRWHTRVELYPHGSDAVIRASELNYSNVNRNGINNYFVADADGHYDLRIHFADGTVMLPEEYPELSDVVPAEVGGMLVVYKPATAGTGGPPAAPRDFALESVYPNPFNSTATIRYRLWKAVHVTLSIYALDGRRVADLVRAPMAVGEHTVRWNAEGHGSGIYFVRLAANGQRAQMKVVLLR